MTHTARRISFKRNLLTLALSALLPVAASAQTMVPGQLKVGMEITYPPFESWQGDTVVGVQGLQPGRLEVRVRDPDMAEMLGRELKLKPSFVDTKFPSLILGLGGGQFDAVISGMYITPERTAQADAIAYGKTGAAIMVAKDGGVMPKTENDLCGLKVGLQAGTSWVNALKKLSAEYCVPQGKPAVAVSEFPTAPEASQVPPRCWPSAARAASSSARKPWCIRRRWASTSRRAIPPCTRPCRKRWQQAMPAESMQPSSRNTILSPWR